LRVKNYLVDGTLKIVENAVLEVFVHRGATNFVAIEAFSITGSFQFIKRSGSGVVFLT